MSILNHLMQECIERSELPETCLALADDQPKLDGKSLSPFATLYRVATDERFPLVARIYTSIMGAGAAEDISSLSQDLLSGKDSIQEDQLSLFVKPYQNLYKAGISLSWWFFGIGEPLHAQPSLPMGFGRDDEQNQTLSLMVDQGWSQAEATWFLEGRSEDRKRINEVITKIMNVLPPQKLLPDMPDPISASRMLTSATDDIELPPGSDEWLIRSVALLKNAPWLVSTLLFSSHDVLLETTELMEPHRTKIQRLAFAISRIFLFYGQHDGLILYLTILNEEAKELGFTDLSEVLKISSWQK